MVLIVSGVATAVYTEVAVARREALEVNNPTGG